jgi:hypothetical protein
VREIFPRGGAAMTSEEEGWALNHACKDRGSRDPIINITIKIKRREMNMNMKIIGINNELHGLRRTIFLPR